LQGIHSVHQGDRDISQYFIHLKVLWQELDVLRPILQCIFETKCSCAFSTSMRENRENEYVC
jgi:hypothetical protein